MRRGGTWSQEAWLKASNAQADDRFGYGIVALSGSTVVVPSIDEGSSATGVNGNQANNSALYSGAAYIFSIGGSSAQEQWRSQYFGSAANTGDGADDADPDFDGLVNRLEFAAGSHPLQPGAALIAGFPRCGS